MTTSFAPFPFYDMYTDHLRPLRYPGEAPVYQDESSLPAITATTTSAWQELEPKLLELMTAYDGEHAGPRFGSPARLEFFVSDESEGLNIFDSYGRHIVHVQPAKLGYNGSGPTLSINVMRLLGVSDEIIQQLQTELRGVPLYKVVVTREVRADDEIRATAGAEVATGWTWWDVS